jgi:hypothetical protein
LRRDHRTHVSSVVAFDKHFFGYSKSFIKNAATSYLFPSDSSSLTNEIAI